MAPLRLLRPASAMPMLSLHPRLDALSDLLLRSTDDGDAADVGDVRRRTRTAAHVAGCVRCQDSLRFLRTLGTVAMAAPDAPAIAERLDAEPTLPPDLLERVLRTRAAGGRFLLPITDVAPPARSQRWVLAAIAAVLLAVVSLGLAWREQGVEAGTMNGELQVQPAMPIPGETISIRYRPSARLSGQPWLALRARLRSPGAGPYDVGIPIRTLARLRPAGDGTYAATLALPDSVVFAAFAVEDSAGTIVDDNGGRVWEVLTAAPDGRPLFAALDQRANDLMGRDWGEGLPTARRMVTLYPESLRAWHWLFDHQGWMGRAQDDTVRQVHRAQLAAFDARLRAQAHPAAEAMGALAWYAADIDSALSAAWYARLLREAPANGFAITLRLRALRDTLRATRDTARALAAYDAIWRDASADRRVGLSMSAFALALPQPDGATTIRWGERLIAADRNPLGPRMFVARRLVDKPALRAEGMARLRRLVVRFDSLPPAERGLTETVAAQRASYAVSQRISLAALGRALVAEGRMAAALDTLARAAATGWELETFRAVREASLAAGDSTTARRMAARMAIDPRVDAAFADSVRRALSRAALDSAREEFVARVLADAPVRALRAPVMLRDANGQHRDLRELAAGRVTIVAVWSPCCGVALADLPRVQAAADRLARDGVRVVSVALGETGPTAALTEILGEKRVRLPTYFDPERATRRAFNSSAVPSYFVLDAEGRVWFDRENRADQALVRAEALRLSTASRSSATSGAARTTAREASRVAP